MRAKIKDTQPHLKVESKELELELELVKGTGLGQITW